MNAHVARALLDDAYFQVLDNKVDYAVRQIRGFVKP